MAVPLGGGSPSLTGATAGHTISVKQPLCSDAVVDGGFAKLGEGTLSLMNTNTYNGATRVVAGILKLGASNTLWTAGTASVSSGAVLDVNGTVQALAGIGGSGWITNNASLSVAGTVSPGETNACGTLSQASPCALSGTLSWPRKQSRQQIPGHKHRRTRCELSFA